MGEGAKGAQGEAGGGQGLPWALRAEATLGCWRESWWGVARGVQGLQRMVGGWGERWLGEAAPLLSTARQRLFQHHTPQRALGKIVGISAFC